MLRLLRKNRSAGIELGVTGDLLFGFKDGGLGTVKTSDFTTYATGVKVGYVVHDSVFVNGKLTVVGYDGTTFLIRSTTDGINWTAANGSDLGKPAFTSIAYGNGVYVAVSRNNNVYYSTDAVNWTKATTPATNTTIAGRQTASVRYGSGRFVVSCTDDRVITSTNGSTWTTVTTGIYLGDLSYANGKWSGTGRQNDYKWKSDDGLSWSTNGSAGYGLLPTNTVYANGKWYYIRSDGYVYTSTDGVSFSRYAAQSQLQPPASKLVVKGNVLAYGTANGYIITSRDGGVTWRLKYFASDITFSHIAIV